MIEEPIKVVTAELDELDGMSRSEIYELSQRLMVQEHYLRRRLTQTVKIREAVDAVIMQQH